MGRKRMPGLRQRNGVWHIDKRIRGYGRLQQSTGACDLDEAERVLVHRLEQIRQQTVYGERAVRSWREAATKYLEEEEKRSLARDAQALKILDPYIGDLALAQIHDDTLANYKADRRAAGIRSGTVRRDLAVVRRILRLAASVWRDERNRPWLDAPPLIRMPNWNDTRRSYPLTFDEQRALFRLLPDHLHQAALFKVNTGCREGEVCALRWDWEFQVAELGASVFIVPGRFVKNAEERLVVLNRIAQSVVDAQRGCHRTHVFTYKGEPIRSMENSAWRRAWAEAGLPITPEVRRGVHNLKHTFGRRLRAIGVPLETRRVLLGHTNHDITVHYSGPELLELHGAVRKLADMGVGKMPAPTLLRLQSTNN